MGAGGLGGGAGHRGGGRIRRLVPERAPGRVTAQQLGHDIADFSEPTRGLCMRAGQERKPARRTLVDRRRARGALAEDPFGLGFGGRKQLVSFLARLRGGLHCLSARRLARHFRLFACRGDETLRLALRRGQHALGLFAGVGERGVGLALSVTAELRGLLVRAGPLCSGLIFGELENLRDPLADLLVRRLAGWLLVRGGKLQAELLALIESSRELFFQVASLAAAAGNKFVDLPTAVAAHLNFERVFVEDIRQEFAVLSHGVSWDSSQWARRCRLSPGCAVSRNRNG